MIVQEGENYFLLGRSDFSRFEFYTVRRTRGWEMKF